MRALCSLVYISLCLSLVFADYTIDDSNYSVLKFSENPAGPVWGPFGSDTGEVLEIRLPNGTMQTIDATQCYDGTYTYAACNTSNNCAVEFSFTGSGITIYVLRAGPQGMSASLSVDSGTAMTATLDAPPAPQYYIPRAVLFDIQNITSGTHTAVMTVLNWNGGFSGMMLDYVDINQAEVAAPTTSPSASSIATQSSSTSSPTSSGSSTGTTTSSVTPSVASVVSVMSSQSSGVLSSQSSEVATPTPSNSGNDTTNATSKQTNVATAVGGGVGGGVGLLALIGLTILCFRRRDRRNKVLQNEGSRPFLEAAVTSNNTPSTITFENSASPSASQAQTIGVTRTMQSWPEAGSTPNLVARGRFDSTPNITHPSSASEGATSFVPVSTSTPAQLPQPVIQSGSTVLPVSYPNEKSEPASGTRPAQIASREVLDSQNAALTDEQADFVNGLFNHSVPAPAIARVLERMLANPHGASSTGTNDPELRAHLDPRNLSQMQRPEGPWLSGMSDLGDGETTIGTAPPSYDYAQQDR